MKRVLAVLVAALLASGGCAGGEATDLDEAEAAIDRLFAAIGGDDPDQLVAAFADEFYFKGLSPYESVRTDAGGIISWAEMHTAHHLRVERVGSITENDSGALVVEANIFGTPGDRVAQMELEVHEGKISRLVTTSWEEPG